MSALAMILTVAIAVPGDGPEKMSMQMVETLNLSGEWEGTYRRRGSPDSGWVWLRNGELSLYISWLDKTIDYSPFRAEDTGKGRLRIHLGEKSRLGIYRLTGDNVIISMRPSEKGYPSSFDSLRDGEWLLILHRVKPRK